MTHLGQEDNTNLVTTSFRLSKSQKRLLTLCSSMTGKTESELLRYALDKSIDRYANEGIEKYVAARQAQLQEQVLELKSHIKPANS